MSWTDGYVTDIQYTTSFFRELTPAHIDFALVASGIRPPSAPSAYCEIGCGQGFSTNVVAALNPHLDVHGIDFNPGHVANARDLAAEAGLRNVSFHDYSFEEACALPADALPKFDYIVLHGVYTWISAENRRWIVKFIDQRLKPGGAVYVSYNAMPGWAMAVPLQRLFLEVANRTPGRSDRQMEAGIKMMQQLREAGAAYFSNNPALAARMDKLPTMSLHYLPHEYLNQHWFALFHSEVVTEMDQARLTYVASATLAENIDATSIPAKMQPIVRDEKDPVMRELLRDYASNKSFRRDLFVRGPVTMPALEAQRRIGDLKLVLIDPTPPMPPKFQTALGEVSGNEAIYAPIIDALKQRPHSLTELANLPALAGRGLNTILQAAMLISHAGFGGVIVPDADGVRSASAKAFNRTVADRALIDDIYTSIALPAVGSAIGLTQVERLIIAAIPATGGEEIEAVSTFVWNALKAQNRRLVRDGKALATDEDNLKEVRAGVERFFASKLSILKALGAI